MDLSQKIHTPLFLSLMCYDYTIDAHQLQGNINKWEKLEDLERNYPIKK